VPFGQQTFASACEYYSAVFNSQNVLYLAYQDEANNDTLTVKRWNAGAYIWESVGGGVVSDGQSWYSGLAFDSSDRPYVIYMDKTKGDKATVKRLNAAGTGWEVVGTGEGQVLRLHGR